MDITEERKEDLIALRRDLHAHPEPGNREFRTSRLVAERLRAAGLIVRYGTETGLIAELRGAMPGKTLVLRADMDCLPLQEDTRLPYASQNHGYMHACGHDIHTTALVGTAEILASLRSRIVGTVRFLFQPDEEGDGGSKGGAGRLIQAGCMEDADAVLGCHVDPCIEPGKAGFRYGTFYAASNPFNVTVRGRASHVARPDTGIDAILGAAAIVSDLKSLLTRETEGGERCIISVGTIRGGVSRNIIAGGCRMEGAIRTLGSTARERIVQEVEETIMSAAQRTGTFADLEMIDGYMGITNNDAAVDFVRAAAEKTLGSENIVLIDHPLMTSEDFGYYGEYAPCCYFHVGAGGQEPLHSPRFAPDESAIFTAASVFIQATLDFCKESE